MKKIKSLLYSPNEEDHIIAGLLLQKYSEQEIIEILSLIFLGSDNTYTDAYSIDVQDFFDPPRTRRAVFRIVNSQKVLILGITDLWISNIYTNSNSLLYELPENTQIT